MTVYLADLTAPQVALRVGRRPLAILPVGTVEWHAEHLPIGVDAHLAIRLAAAIAEETDCLVAPPIWYGISRNLSAQNGFDGTIVTIREETLAGLISDVLGGLAGFGFRAVLVLSGHYEAPHYMAIQRGMAAYPGLLTRLFNEAELIEGLVSPQATVEETWPYAGDHAAEFETSLMLVHFPEMVEMDKAPPSVELPGDVPAYIQKRYPRRASADYGIKLHRAILTAGRNLVEEMLAAIPPVSGD